MGGRANKHSKDIVYLYVIDSSDSVRHLNEIYDMLELNEFLSVLAVHNERDLDKKILFMALDDVIKDLPKIIDYNVMECNTQVPRLLVSALRAFMQDKKIDGIMISEKFKEVAEKLSESLEIPLMTY
ncbi:MAG: hypothetical protein ACE5K4_01480 [Candidatus Hydrothermarchaeota archaeon]